MTKDYDLFSFDDYKAYLAEALAPRGETRGKRTRLAGALGCRAGFISQVIQGHVHFTLEHAVEVSEFLRHSPAEARFFLLLVSEARAGNVRLRARYQEEKAEMRQQRSLISRRLQSSPELNTEEQSLYYGEWAYAAIHVLVSIPEYRTRKAIAGALELSLTKVQKILDDLVRMGLLVVQQGEYRVQLPTLHLDRGSPLIARHHANWRLRALRAMEEGGGPEDLHFSSALTLSRADALRVRTLLLECLESVDRVVGPSEEQTAIALNVDLFSLLK